MPSDTQWDRVWELFEAALDVPARERAAWVTRAAGDSRIAGEVNELLAAHVRDAGVLDQPAAPALDADNDAPYRTNTSTPEADPYRIVKEIGRGGMGVVYLAEDPRLERRVALKFLSSQLTGDPKARRRLLREARAASRLDHPNICAVYDVGEASDGRPYVAMAYYEGPTVAELIEDGPLEVGRAVEIARQAARGLALAHGQGVIHRDIKPSNLLLDGGKNLRVLDFGVAKLIGSTATDSGVRLGTPLYMAPEQIIGKPIGPHADLWALGVVLYEMIAGTRPFSAEREMTAIYEILNEDPTPLSSKAAVAPELDRLITRLLEKDPEKRYASAAELAADLEALEAAGRAAPPHNLTAARNRLIGRERELEELAELLADRRLVTLTGPGGSGKTRLALEVSRRLQPGARGGTFFVALAPIREPELIATAAAASIPGIDPTVPALEGLKAWIGPKPVLLTLDNFEQVLGGAPLVGELLAACPNLRILVTSRAPLRVTGEQEYPVHPLAAPQPSTPAERLEEFPAVALFLERAREAAPDLKLDAAALGAVRDLCLRLDGLPLAIELAAARLRLFSPEALLERLGESLNLLESRDRDRPERHRTLRQAVAWSADLLDESAGCVFRRFGAFRGGATLEALEAVCERSAANIMAAVEELVDHNLVRRSEGARRPRFMMLETIREQAVELLCASGEREAANRAHSAYFLSLAEQAAPLLTGPEQKAWTEQLHVDQDNLRAALVRAVSNRETESALHLVAALWRFWIIRGNVEEALERCRAVFALPFTDVDPRLRANALHGYATVAHYRGDNSLARELADRTVEIWRSLGDRRGLAAALTNRAWVSCETSELDEARRLSLEALALHEENDDRRGIALAVNNLGWVANYRGMFREALAWHERSLALRDEIGDRRGRAFALPCIAWTHRIHGDYERAHALIDESLAILDEIGDPTLRGWALTVRTHCLLDQGKWKDTASTADQAREAWAEGKNRIGLAWCAAAQGEVKRVAGRPVEARTLLRQALDQWEASGFRWGVAEAERRLALVDKAVGRDRDARRGIARAFGIVLDLGDRLGAARCLEAYAQIEDDHEAALEALATARGIREELETPLAPAASAAISGRRDEAEGILGAIRAADVLERARASGPEAVARGILARLPGS